MPLGTNGAGDPLLGGSLLRPGPLEARIRIKQVSYGILHSSPDMIVLAGAAEDARWLSPWRNIAMGLPVGRCCVIKFDQLGRLTPRHVCWVRRGKAEGSRRRDGEERL